MGTVVPHRVVGRDERYAETPAGWSGRRECCEPIGATWSRWRRGRNAGRDAVQYRRAWIGERTRSPVMLEERCRDGHVQHEIRVEFNPGIVHQIDARAAADSLRVFGLTDAGRMFVERVDVAFDLVGEHARRQWFRLDGGPRRKVKTIGVAGKPETEMVGFVKGCKRKLRLYDKRLERSEVGGVDAGVEWLRFECEAWAPFATVDVEGEREVRLCELHLLRNPVPDGVYVRELVRPETFGDRRYALLSVASWVYGPAASLWAAETLGMRDQRERLAACAFPEVGAGPCCGGTVAEKFEREWAGAVHTARGVLS